jgi:type IV secretion system protein VirB9
MKKTVLFLMMAALPASVMAQTYEPDSRLRTIDYDPAAVVRLEGCQNFQTMITLAPDEHVENVGVGDSAAWQVTPNKRGNLIFVKALASRGYTNMSMVSDKRSYSFELRMAPDSDCSHGRITYELRFRYPPAPSTGTGTPVNPAPAPDPNAFLPVPEKRNAAYTFTGAADLVPIRVFDDGISTYMKWATGVTAPAVYALNADNSESIVNYASRGDYFVVEQVSPGFVLRRGDQKAVLYNDTYAVQGLDSLSPKPRGKNGSAK